MVSELLMYDNYQRVGLELRRCHVANAGTLATTLSMSRTMIRILLEKWMQDGQVEILRPCRRVNPQHEEEDDSVFYLWKQPADGLLKDKGKLYESQQQYELHYSLFN